MGSKVFEATAPIHSTRISSMNKSFDFQTFINKVREKFFKVLLYSQVTDVGYELSDVAVIVKRIKSFCTNVECDNVVTFIE